MNYKKSSDIAISVKNISKTFRIPHEKMSSLRGTAVNLFRSGGYEEFKALDDVSFEVKKGEFFGIIGRNGSGKSTLLKILANIYQPDKGKIKIDGMVSPFLELGIGFNPELSGRDNVYLNATVLGMTKRQIDEKFNSIMQFSELERFIDQKLKNYSSGMSVRLAFSVAIHANRDILLMDEVLAVGDSNFQQKCLEEFNKYKKKGKTVILVSHDILTIQQYCSRALVLKDGGVDFIGNAEDAGSFYINQNIKDEEVRLKRDDFGEIVSNDNKKVEIQGVEFFDKNGSPKKVFKTGDDIRVRIKYRAKEEIENPVFGIAIYTQEGIHITGPNTQTSGYEISKINGNGLIDFVIANNFLLENSYKLTVNVYRKECAVPYDFKDKKYEFKITNNIKNQFGNVVVDHYWEISK